MRNLGREAAYYSLIMLVLRNKARFVQVREPLKRKAMANHFFLRLASKACFWDCSKLAAA